MSPALQRAAHIFDLIENSTTLNKFASLLRWLIIDSRLKLRTIQITLSKSTPGGMGLGERADPLENPTTKRQFHLNSARYIKPRELLLLRNDEWRGCGGLACRWCELQISKIWKFPFHLLSFGCGWTCRLGAFLLLFLSFFPSLFFYPHSHVFTFAILHSVYDFSHWSFFFAGCYFCPHCVCRAHTAQFYVFSRTKTGDEKRGWKRTLQVLRPLRRHGCSRVRLTTAPKMTTKLMQDESKRTRRKSFPFIAAMES